MIALAYAVSKFILWLFFRLGFGLEVTGAEHVPRTGSFVLASNHVSYLDPPLLGAACPRRLRFMARASLFHHWLLGTFMRSVGVMPLQRGQSDLPGLRLAIRMLRRGDAVAIFPEGGRQFSGTLGAAKGGVGLLAVTAQVPVIPVFVNGTFEALHPGSRRLKRTKIRVAFGPQIPYTTSPVPTLTARERHDQLAAQVTQAWHQLAEHLTHE